MALNNTFGYPMVFPAFYFKYNGAFSYKFTIEAASIDGAKIAFVYIGETEIPIGRTYEVIDKFGN